MTNTMTNATSRDSMLIAAAKADCEKRKERKQKIEDFKQLLCCVLVILALLMVAIDKAYPEITSGSTNKANTTTEEIENNIVNADGTNEEMQSTEIQHETDTPTEVVTKTESETSENVENIETENDQTTSYNNLSEAEICLLVQAVQHETGSSPDFYPYGDFDIVQQYMAASIINRIGEPGFGSDYSTAYTLTDVLSNSTQYGNLLWELDQFGDDERTRKNVLSVLSGEANIPEYLYFERCSYVGEDYYSAQDSFYGQYGYNSNISIVYMSLTLEGRYIIFAANPSGAYAF